MNRKMSFQLFALTFSLISNSTLAYILFDKPSVNFVSTVAYNKSPHNSSELVRSLERITGLELEVSNNYLRLKTLPPVPLMYAALSLDYSVIDAVPSQIIYSRTARNLLLDAMRSTSVYRVRENKDAALGRVKSGEIIELDFSDFGNIVYRDVPKEAFDIGMIFLHELVHRHLRLTDPSPAEIRKNPFAKGNTVRFVNRIERELGLPERRHYAPVKIRLIRDDPKWGIYFGKQPDRIEIDRSFAIR